MRTRRAGLLGLLLLVGLGVPTVGCGSARVPVATAGGAHRSPARAGEGPSVSAQMICASEAQAEVAQALGITAGGRATAAWAAPVYSCTYVFPAGVLVLSVRELAGAAETSAYFTSVQSGAGASTRVPDLGEAAFAVADGSVYVRKDFKVLQVDVSKLPAFLGQPPISRAAGGVRVAGVIMGCWTGN